MPSSLHAEIFLPASKSISNRVLIIRALSGIIEPVSNLSDAKDTLDLLRCLESHEKEIHVGEGATTLRFLLAYYCITQQTKILHCSPTLQQRPLKELILVLEQLGCKFRYLENEYHLPLEILQGIQSDYPEKIIIKTNVSSQFISAILLVAPYLNNGLEIEYSNAVVSEPYIQMTKKLMKEFGIQLKESNHIIRIFPAKYLFQKYFIEADWSSASFFYAFLGILGNYQFYFTNLRNSELQGDEILVDFFKQFGIITSSDRGGITIQRETISKPEIVEFDFTNYPDLFPPLSIFCAITKTNAKFNGLQNLVHKESNRLKIITDFLLQQNVKIHYQESTNGTLSAEFEMSSFDFDIPSTYSSHNDHRIAMSFSLLNTIKKIKIENPEVVEKSFPGYWQELNKILLNHIGIIGT